LLERRNGIIKTNDKENKTVYLGNEDRGITNMNIIMSDRKNKQVVFSICTMVFLPGINNFINSIMQTGMGLSTTWLTPIVYIFLAIIGAYSYVLCFRYNQKMLFVAFLVISGMFFSFFLYPEIRKSIFINAIDLVYNDVYRVVFYCLPSLFLITICNDLNKLFKSFVKWSLFTVVTGIAAYVYVDLIKGYTLQYMVYSYFMLTAVCVCYEKYRKDKQMMFLFLGILGSIAMILCGSRGAVMSLLGFIVVRFIIFNDVKKTVNKVVIIIISLTFVVTMYLNYDSILIYLINMFEKYGINSRTLNSLFEGTLTESYGRDTIRDAIWTGVIKSPIFGYGLFGDRYLAGTYGYGSFTYAHNIFLEAISDFGLVFGIPLLIVFFVKIIKTVFHIQRQPFRSVFFVVIPYGFFQLIFSGAAITNNMFYMLCGLLLLTAKQRKEKNYGNI
jgi:hypothetical protein